MFWYYFFHVLGEKRLIMQYTDYESENIQTRRNILTEVFQRDFQNYMNSRKSGDEKKIKEAKLRMMESKKKLNDFEERVKVKLNNFSNNSYNGGRSK